MPFRIWPPRGKIVASEPLSLCWSMFVLSRKVDGRDAVDGVTEVCPSEAVSRSVVRLRVEGTPSPWRRVCLFLEGGDLSMPRF